jgi:hypothetical protein
MPMSKGLCCKYLMMVSLKMQAKYAVIITKFYLKRGYKTDFTQLRPNSG